MWKATLALLPTSKRPRPCCTRKCGCRRALVLLTGAECALNDNIILCPFELMSCVLCSDQKLFPAYSYNHPPSRGSVAASLVAPALPALNHLQILSISHSAAHSSARIIIMVASETEDNYQWSKVFTLIATIMCCKKPSAAARSQWKPHSQAKPTSHLFHRSCHASQPRTHSHK